MTHFSRLEDYLAIQDDYIDAIAVWSKFNDKYIHTHNVMHACTHVRTLTHTQMHKANAIAN